MPPEGRLGQDDASAESQDEKLRGMLPPGLAQGLAGQIAHDQRQTETKARADFGGSHGLSVHSRTGFHRHAKDFAAGTQARRRGTSPRSGIPRQFEASLFWNGGWPWA